MTTDWLLDFYAPLYAPADEGGAGDGGEGADSGEADGGEKKPPEGDAGADGGDGEGAEEKPDKAGTVLDDEKPKNNKEKPDDIPDVWGELKTKIAGDDKKLLGRLNRYSSLESFAKAGLTAQDKIRSGEFVRPLADDASEEDIAKYREENNIPATPEGYELPEVKGFEWSDDDKQVVGDFFTAVHAVNMERGLVSAVTEWYAKTQLKNAEATHEADKQDANECEDALRLELGPSYRGALKAVDRLVSDKLQGFGEVGEGFLDARLPDGRRLRDNPATMNHLIQIAERTYGDLSFASGEGAEAMAGRKDEIKSIMKEDPERYYREGLDKEYFEILEREHKAGTKAA